MTYQEIVNHTTRRINSDIDGYIRGLTSFINNHDITKVSMSEVQNMYFDYLKEKSREEIDRGYIPNYFL